MPYLRTFISSCLSWGERNGVSVDLIFRDHEKAEAVLTLRDSEGSLRNGLFEPDVVVREMINGKRFPPRELSLEEYALLVKRELSSLMASMRAERNRWHRERNRMGRYLERDLAEVYPAPDSDLSSSASVLLRQVADALDRDGSAGRQAEHDPRETIRGAA